MKNFTTLLTDFKRVAVCMSFAALATFGLQAADKGELVDLGALENGVAKEYPGKVEGEPMPVVCASFTVPEDGPVRVVCTGTELVAYSSTDYTDKNQLKYDFNYVGGNPMRQYECKKGDVIYFYNDFVYNGGTITATSGDVKVELLGTTPSADPESGEYYGGAFSISSNYRVSFSFNIPVVASGARMSVNGGATQELSITSSGTILEMQIAPDVMRWYEGNLAKKDDTLHIEVYGVCEKGKPDNKVNGDGVASVDFVLAEQPISVVSSVNIPTSGNGKMLSYYAPGNPAGLMTLTFSGDIDTKKATPMARIFYGDLDNIEVGMYQEFIEGKVDGNSVTFDLSGKLRRPQDMLPALEDPMDCLAFSCFSIYGAGGQMAYTGNITAPGSFNYTYDIEVLQYNVIGDFTPAEGSSLVEGEEMEIFVMDGDKVEFNGVKFAYTAAGAPAEVIVPKDRLNIGFENKVDMVMTLPVPALPGIDAGSAVIVTLADMTCADGLDHSGNVIAEYKDYTVGLEGVETEASAMDVYSAQGILVLKDAIKAEVRNLPAGLYIAGGKKIIVR